MLPWASYSASSALCGRRRRLQGLVGAPDLLVRRLLDGLEVDVRAGVARPVERERLRVGVDVRVRRVRTRQVRERPEARQRDRQRPPLRGAVGAVLGADVGDQWLAVGAPEDGAVPDPAGQARPTRGCPPRRALRPAPRARPATLGDSAVVPVVGRWPTTLPPSGATTPRRTGWRSRAALTTTMVAMAATTRPTGTRAVMTRMAGAEPGAVHRRWTRSRALETGRVVTVFLVFVVGRAERDGQVGPCGPMGDFDIVFSWVDRGGGEAHTLGGSKRRPGAVSGADDARGRGPRNGRPDARQARCRARRTGAGGTAGLVAPAGRGTAVPAGDGRGDGRRGGHIPATTANSATPGDGAAGAGLPLPHVASRHSSRGPDAGRPRPAPPGWRRYSAAESTPCGMKPPTTAAAMIATRPTRHRKDMAWRLGGRISTP